MWHQFVEVAEDVWDVGQIAEAGVGAGGSGAWRAEAFALNRSSALTLSAGSNNSSLQQSWMIRLHRIRAFLAWYLCQRSSVLIVLEYVVAQLATSDGAVDLNDLVPVVIQTCRQLREDVVMVRSTQMNGNLDVAVSEQILRLQSTTGLLVTGTNHQDGRLRFQNQGSDRPSRLREP